MADAHKIRLAGATVAKKMRFEKVIFPLENQNDGLVPKISVPEKSLEPPP